MHELALMTSMVNRVCEIAKQNNAKKITKITVKRGEISGVIPEALNFCFDICVSDTIAQKAAFLIIDVPAKWKRKTCGQIISKVDDLNIPFCPKCNNYDLSFIEGREFQLDSIEVE